MVAIPSSVPPFLSEEHPDPSKKAMFLALIASEMAFRTVSAPSGHSISVCATPSRKNLNIVPRAPVYPERL